MRTTKVSYTDSGAEKKDRATDTGVVDDDDDDDDDDLLLLRPREVRVTCVEGGSACGLGR